MFKDDDSVEAYFGSIRAYPQITADQARSLVRSMRAGNPDSREKLILGNLLLVPKVARHYRGNGLDYLDLIMAGNEGLALAADKYNPTPTMKAKFSTYATEWIRERIIRALAETGESIRVPYDVFGARNRLARSGNIPLVTQVSVKRLSQAPEKPLSLDAPINDSDDETYADTLGDDSASVERVCIDNEQRAQLRNLIKMLPARDVEIIALRYGFIPSERTYTLAQIARRYGVDISTIALWERGALARLRVIAASVLPDASKSA